MNTSRTPARRFYCYPADTVEGPFELVELASLLRANHITGETPTLLEGESDDKWIPFQSRNEFHFAKEIPQDALDRHFKEKAEEHESPFTLRKLAVLFWVMAPFFLYLAYRLLRMYIIVHLHNDPDPNQLADPSSGSN